MRSSSRFARTGVLLFLYSLFLFPVHADDLKQTTLLMGEFDVVVKECKEQIPEGKVEQCLAALRSLDTRVSSGQTDAMSTLKVRLGHRIGIAEAYKQAGAYGSERPDLYFRTLFKAYAAIPEPQFPYEEVLPLWNLYLREDLGRAKFSRYRKLKLIVRAPRAEKELEDAYFRTIQERLLEFGFSLIDPTAGTSALPDILLKVQLKGEMAGDSTDPRLQFKKVYRLTLDIQSFKFLSANRSIEPVTEEIEEGSSQLDAAKEVSIQKGCTRLSNLLFYHSLREMFMPSAGGG